MQATLLTSVQTMILQVDFLTASQRFIGSSSNIKSPVSLRIVHITTATLVSTMESIPAGIRRVLWIHVFYKKPLFHSPSQKVRLLWGFLGGDPVFRNTPPEPDSVGNTKNDCKTFTGETCWFPFRKIWTGTKIYFWFVFYSLSVMEDKLLISVRTLILWMDVLTASQRWLVEQCQITCLLQNRRYEDCDMGFNNSTNGC